MHAFLWFAYLTLLGTLLWKVSHILGHCVKFTPTTFLINIFFFLKASPALHCLVTGYIGGPIAKAMSVLGSY